MGTDADKTLHEMKKNSFSAKPTTIGIRMNQSYHSFIGMFVHVVHRNEKKNVGEIPSTVLTVMRKQALGKKRMRRRRLCKHILTMNQSEHCFKRI